MRVKSILLGRTTGLAPWFLWLVLSSFILYPFTLRSQSNNPDTEQLGRALEYFESGKYHESLLIFQRLDKKYKLNPRFRAYIGLCYYYDWDYKKAVQYFNAALPRLGGLAPHELSVYFYSAGESYFQMEKYDSARVYFQKDLQVCFDREKGDIYYRLGLCDMFEKKWESAYSNYLKSEENYVRFRNVSDLKARLAQINNMKRGCEKEIIKIIAIERSKLMHLTIECCKQKTRPSNLKEREVNFNPWLYESFPIFINEQISDNHCYDK